MVLGAGVAGLLAADSLANEYGEVFVVERDVLSDVPRNRAGAAQGRHAHALLARGQQLLETRFPGLTSELAAAGARTGDLLADTRMFVNGNRMHPGMSGLTAISASRALLELHIRQRVGERAAVRFHDGFECLGLHYEAATRRVAGVRLRRRQGDPGATESRVAADLVVDATGRGSRSSSWLEHLGFDQPPVEQLAIDVAYATRRYSMDRGALGGDVAVIVAPTAVRPRGGVLALLEGDVGILTLAGVLGDRPPLDPGEFTEFASRLAVPDIAAAISRATPIDEPVPHRFPASRWRRFDRVRRAAPGFISVGDGVCSLNPIYGQGITAAALQADALDRFGARRASRDPKRCNRRIARVVQPAWSMAAGADLEHPGVPGRRNLGHRILGRYLRRLQATASVDPTVSTAFARVSGLVDQPTALLRPNILRRVMRRSSPASRP